MADGLASCVRDNNGRIAIRQRPGVHPPLPVRVEVRDAAGHASIATTSVYTHVATDDDGAVGDLFEFESVDYGTNTAPRSWQVSKGSASPGRRG